MNMVSIEDYNKQIKTLPTKTFFSFFIVSKQFTVYSKVLGVGRRITLRNHPKALLLGKNTKKFVLDGRKTNAGRLLLPLSILF